MDDAIVIASRQRRIAELERKNAEIRARMARQHAQYEAFCLVSNQAIENYIAALTAPMRAFIDEMRR